MHFECRFCSRKFSKRSAYALHTPVCTKRPESDSETSSIDVPDVGNETENESFLEETHENTSFDTEMSEASTMNYEESQNFPGVEEFNFQEPEVLEFQEVDELEYQMSDE